MDSKVKNDAKTYWSRMSKQIEEGKRATADYLGRQSDKLSLKGRKLTFIIFGLMTASICLILIIRPFQDSKTTRHSVPKEILISITPVPVQQPDSVFSHEDYRTLLQFKLAMDSLKKVNPVVYNDILKDRHGLMDSVNFLIEIYR